MDQHPLIKVIAYRWYLLIAYMGLAYAFARIVVVGSEKVGVLTDQLFSGGHIDLMTVVQPFVGLTLVGALVAFLMKYVQMTMSLLVQTDVKNITVQKLVKLEYKYFDRTGTGSIMNKLIGDIFHMEVLFSEVLPQMMINLVVIVTVSYHIFLMNWQLMLVTMTSYPVLLWLAHLVAKKMGQLSWHRRALYDALENVAMDTYNGILVGRTYNLDEAMTGRIDQAVGDILTNEYKRTIVNSFTSVTGNLMRWIPTIICYLYALFEVLNGRLTLGTLLAFIILLDRIVHPLGEIPGLMNGFREKWVSFRRLESITLQSDEPSGTGTYTPMTDKPLIRFRDLTFGYNQEDILFDKLNFAIYEGSHVALVGGSGCGKSTIFKILCSFYQHRSGDYLLYGQASTNWDVTALRDQFSLVSQNTYLFPGTIGENVALGKEGASRKDIENACIMANIHGFIRDLPEGYETLVGERGAKLSGGQRQRIAIARAFIKDAPILLLDEPTSAVDVGTENLIKEAIDRIAKDRTVITIAHRLNTIEHADHIFVFEKGGLKESGTHNDLMMEKGAYYRLYKEEGLEDENP